MANEPIETYVPMFIKQEIEHPERYVVASQKWNELWTLVISQGDHNAEFLTSVIEQLIDNVIRKDNIQPYLPVNDYEPATKLYVDDKVAALEARIAVLEGGVV